MEYRPLRRVRRYSLMRLLLSLGSILKGNYLKGMKKFFKLTNIYNNRVQS